MSKRKIYMTAGLTVLLIAAIIVMAVLYKDKSDQIDGPVYKVKRGSLTISFVESGTVKASDQIIIKNEVEGRTSIISLIPEGTRVKKDELLIELDASSLLDQRVNQEINVQNIEASYIGSKENLAVVENQTKSDVDLAELDLQFSRQDLEKYIQGEYPYELNKADAQIALAKEELVQAQETLQWSRKLYEEDYISQTELQRDELAEKKKTLDVQLAKESKYLLTQYTYTRKLAQLKSDVSQAEMALERTQRKARADVIQAQADLRARQAEFQRQKDRLIKIIDQLEKTKIYAPADGLVIYATSAKGSGFRRMMQEPLDEGSEVREREELIYLPIGNFSKAEISIHESNLKKTRLGLPVIITVDALQGKESVFYGTVKTIAPLPDPQSAWMNPDLKVYNSEIDIEGENEILRTGMSCQAEVVIEQYKDVLFVPLQAVIRIGSEPAVYVKTSGGPFEIRKVKTGLDNNKMIHVIEGLEENDTVLLSPPLGASTVDNKEHEDMLNRISNNNTQTYQKQAQQQQPMPKIDPEKMKEMKEKFDKMSPEEKEKAMKQFGNRKKPDQSQ